MIRFILQAILIASLSASGGCTLISLSALSSVASLGNSSVSQGRDSYFFGKLKTAEMSRFDAARSAVKSAAGDLGLKIKMPETMTPHCSEMQFVDDEGSLVGVRIDRQSDTLVRLRVDVGWFGSEVTDRLFLMRVRAHLPDPTSRPSF